MRSEVKCFDKAHESLFPGLKMVLKEVQRVKRTILFESGTIGLDPSITRINYVALDFISPDEVHSYVQ